MADLGGLIRVRKHAVEEKQKFIAGLYRQSAALAGEKAGLLEQLDGERAHIREFGAAMLSYFGPYSEAVKERVGEIDRAAAGLEDRITAAREDMRAAFAELKKIEIISENRRAAAAKTLNKQAAAELDAIAIENFRRRQDA